MAIISTKRHATAGVNPNLRIGGKPKPKRHASDQEIRMLNKAISNLNEAKSTTNDTVFRVKVGNAFACLRQLLCN